MNRPRSAFRFPRALLAAATALALAAPYAATFGCRGGDCCGPQLDAQRQDAMSQHMQHHGAPEQVPHRQVPTLSGHVSTSGCPMVVACGTANIAVVLRAQATVPFLPILESDAVPGADLHQGRLLSPLTPPPRA